LCYSIYYLASIVKLAGAQLTKNLNSVLGGNRRGRRIEKTKSQKLAKTVDQMEEKEYR
jgi:hypothetical protein